MYNNDTELLYPMRVTQSLRNIRDEKWTVLIDRILSDDTEEIEKMAFTLMMVKIDGCINCNTDSFRAMRGCTQCAKQNIKRFRGNDQELFEMYDHAVEEMKHYLTERQL